MLIAILVGWLVGVPCVVVLATVPRYRRALWRERGPDGPAAPVIRLADVRHARAMSAVGSGSGRRTA